MKGTKRFIISCALVLQSIFCYKVGGSVFEEYEAQLFSHSFVPVETSVLFLVLLVGIGITLGYLIRGPGKIIQTIIQMIILWPWVHFIGLIVLFCIGGIWAPAMVLALYSFLVLPINLIGEGVSIGFSITRLFSRQGSKMEAIAMILLNLLIIALVLWEMSKEYRAEFIW